MFFFFVSSAKIDVKVNKIIESVKSIILIGIDAFSPNAKIHKGIPIYP